MLATNLRGWTHGRVPDPVAISFLEAGLDAALAATAVLILWRLRRLQILARVIRSAWPLAPFLVLGAASAMWTIHAGATVARVIILLSCSVLAAYLAARYSLDELVQVLAGLFGALALVSAFAVLAVPGMGTTLAWPYSGSWNGVFWHRNYLGSTMAAGAAVLLLSALMSLKARRRSALGLGLLFAVAVALVLGSRSATGLILLLILHAVLLGVVAWLRWRNSLRPFHYVLAGLAAVAVSALALGNLDWVLGLFNRTSTFTGRTTLWQFLLQAVVAQRPWFGHGLGTLWTSPGFQRAVQGVVKWPYPVLIGDNGFVDVLLQLGGAGIGLLSVYLLWAAAVGIRAFVGTRTLASAAPFVFLIYLMFTNITLSYFAETESFVWLVMLALALSGRRLIRDEGRAVGILCSPGR